MWGGTNSMMKMKIYWPIYLKLGTNSFSSYDVDGSQVDEVWNIIHIVSYNLVRINEESVRPLPSTSASSSENDRIETEMAETWTSKFWWVLGLQPTWLTFLLFTLHLTAGIAPKECSNLDAFLSIRLPESVTTKDYSLEVLNLIRVLHAFSCYWGTLLNIVNNN